MSLFLKTKDYAITGEEFGLIYAEGEELLITDPQPENLDKYYRSEDYISHTDAKRNLLEKLYALIKRYTLIRKCALITTYANGKKTLLDVGAGTGDFLLKAKSRGWAISGVEPNSLARDAAAKKGVSLQDDLSVVTDEQFQVITLWHVLEHLPKLDAKISQIISLLEKNGTLIIAVPNYKSYDAKHYKKYWAAFDVPRHLWHFSQNGITSLFQKHGMQLVKTKPMYFDAFYVCLLSEKYSTGKTNYLKAFYRGIRSNLKALATTEYSSLIYVFKKN